MFNKIRNRALSAASMLIASAIIFTLSASAAAVTTKDVDYFKADYASMTSTLSNSLKDWASLLKFSAIDNGVRYVWTGAPQNVRLGSPRALNADGLHLVFNNFTPQGSAPCNIAITLSMNASYSDYVTQMNANNLARLPFVLLINPTTGSLTTYASKAYSTANPGEVVNVIIDGSDNLKTAALTGKQWEVRFTAQSGDKYKISVNGAEATIPASYIKGPGSQLNLASCYFVLNTWGVGGNSFSLDLVSLHGGEAACADTIAAADLTRAKEAISKINAIGTVKATSSTSITAARSAYNALTEQLQTLVTNIKILTLAEKVFPVVTSIAAIGTVKLNSATVIAQIESEYLALSDEEKLLVSNYSDFTAAKTQLLKLQFAAGIISSPEGGSDTASKTVSSPAVNEGSSAEGNAEAGESTGGTSGKESSSHPTGEDPEVESAADKAAGGTKSEDKDRNSSDTLTIILIIAAGALILGGIGAAFVIILKRRRTAVEV